MLGHTAIHAAAKTSQSSELALAGPKSLHLGRGECEITPAQVAAAQHRLAVPAPLDRIGAAVGSTALISALPIALLLPAATIAAPIIGLAGLAFVIAAVVSNYRKRAQAKKLLAKASIQAAHKRACQEEARQEKIRARTECLRALAVRLLERATATGRVSQGQNYLFADPEKHESKLRLRLIEADECTDADTGRRFVRVIARLYEAASREEFANSREVEGIGPILHELPLFSPDNSKHRETVNQSKPFLFDQPNRPESFSGLDHSLDLRPI